MADIAAVFHWPPDAMNVMELADLLDWQALAIDRFKAMQPKER